jgi:soluble lytic murein transglycosylase-like protein
LHQETHLTIQDYFNRTRLPKRPAKINRSAQIADSRFSRTLRAVQAGSSEQSNALCIQDYFKTPVQASSPFQPTPAMPRELIPAQPADSVSPLSSQSENDGLSVPESRKEKANIAACIKKAADKYDLSPALLQAVVKAESNFQARAISPAGAQGLMQLMPATARELGVEDPFDIEQNINGGAQYLRRMLDQFDGNLKLALSAYNAGPGTVNRYNGNVPYAETQAYVARVLGYAEQFSTLGRRV